ncbi:hypothetical protein [Nitrospirillum sp. BR 11163]|uniref:hypothetical protein n=1 Tax=Nitrospirillum sp. BR 11163 TaxID=3104323 RepID=UPI002AFDCC90|nr:hypothetical protein [Nitrospirillum sp. BR 11163]MEA1674933.1 hypothetical protein [Nitrospirillum sp. BR 11163]
MRRYLLPLLAVALLALMASTSSWARVAEDKPLPPAQDKGIWLLTKLREIADSGQPLEKNYLEKALNIHLAGEVSYLDSSGCKFSHESAGGQNSRLKAEGGWYAATPEGVQRMEIPGYAINQAGHVEGQPTIYYSSSTYKNCTGWEDVLFKSETTLKFGAFPSFACVTPEAMSKALPEFKFTQATDGVAFFSYRGGEKVGQGTSITVTYRMGAKCMQGIKITQSTESGSTYAKAYSTFWPCSRKFFDIYWTTILKRPLPQYTELQKTAPGMYDILLDSEKEKEAFREYAVKQCGSFESIFQKYAKDKQ